MVNWRKHLHPVTKTYDLIGAFNEAYEVEMMVWAPANLAMARDLLASLQRVKPITDRLVAALAISKAYTIGKRGLE